MTLAEKLSAYDKNIGTFLNIEMTRLLLDTPQ